MRVGEAHPSMLPAICGSKPAMDAAGNMSFAPAGVLDVRLDGVLALLDLFVAAGAIVGGGHGGIAHSYCRNGRAGGGCKADSYYVSHGLRARQAAAGERKSVAVLILDDSIPLAIFSTLSDLHRFRNGMPVARGSVEARAEHFETIGVWNLANSEALADRTAFLVEEACRRGADAADAIALEENSVGVSVLNGKLEHAERSEGTEVGLRVLVGPRQACVSSSDVRQRISG